MLDKTKSAERQILQKAVKLVSTRPKVEEMRSAERKGKVSMSEEEMSQEQEIEQARTHENKQKREDQFKDSLSLVQ